MEITQSYQNQMGLTSSVQAQASEPRTRQNGGAGYISTACGHVCMIGYFSAQVISVGSSIITATAGANYLASQLIQGMAQAGEPVKALEIFSNYTKVMRWPNTFAEKVLLYFFDESSQLGSQDGINMFTKSYNTGKAVYYLYLDPLSLLGHSLGISIVSHIAANFLYDAANYFYGNPMHVKRSIFFQ